MSAVSNHEAPMVASSFETLASQAPQDEGIEPRTAIKVEGVVAICPSLSRFSPISSSCLLAAVSDAPRLACSGFRAAARRAPDAAVRTAAEAADHSAVGAGSADR
jgi:hypothetical protein